MEKGLFIAIIVSLLFIFVIITKAVSVSNDTFENFKEFHDKEIKRIQNSENKTISSMGI